jgi:RND family efflux transporter MFP subunit
MKKKVFIVLAILFVAFLSWRIALLVIGKSNAGAKRSGRPAVAVQVAPVRYAPIRDIREFTGTVYPLYQYIIAPKVSGRIVEITKRIGDPVKRGEVVARIDDAEYQQAVLEAEANLKIAEASIAELKGQAELAKQELDRAQSLRDKGISSTSELDAAVTNNTAQQARLKLAIAQMDQRQAALNSARIRLSYTVLNATEPGFVGERYADEGVLLSPNSPVLSVVGIDRVIIQTTIIERDYGRITPGQEAAVIVDAYPLKRFAGKVARIAPMLQESSRVAKMEVEVNNPERILKPGMFTRVDIVLAENESALVVPSQALVTRQDMGKSAGVFLIDPKGERVAKYIPVETGIVTPEITEILSPRIEGLVVTLGQHLLSDGSPVILPGDSPGGKGRGPGKDKRPDKGGAGGAGKGPAGERGR